MTKITRKQRRKAEFDRMYAEWGGKGSNKLARSLIRRTIRNAIHQTRAIAFHGKATRPRI